MTLRSAPLSIALITVLSIFLGACSRSEKVEVAPVVVEAAAVPEVALTAEQDLAITELVKAGFAADEDFKDVEISVETNNGEVTLKGFVDGNGRLARAIDVANAVEGVKSVNNLLDAKQK